MNVPALYISYTLHISSSWIIILVLMALHVKRRDYDDKNKGMEGAEKSIW